MLAVFVNCAAVIAGSILGLLLKSRFTDKYSESIQTAAGVVTVVMGIQMAFKYQNVVYLALSLIMGGLLGTLWDIDGKILSLGGWLEKVVYRGKKTESSEETSSSQNFAYAFLNASVLFCVGAMAIIGSFKAGVEKDYSIIFTKSILDGFMAISFAAAMGVGTAFSALAILVYQGILTLLSIFIQPYVTDELLNELTGCGGCIIIMIGINLIGLKKIKTANYLPALVLEILFVILVPFVKGLF